MKAGGIFLIIVSGIVSILVLLLAFVSLIKFQHPDDKNQAWLPKIVIIIGYFIVFMVTMVIPFDVADATGQLKLKIDILWYIALIAIAVYLCIIIPFAFFWYENQDAGEDLPPDLRPGVLDTQIGAAIVYTLIFVIVIAVLSIVLYLTPANRAQIPTHLIIADITNDGVLEDLCTAGTVDPTNPTVAAADVLNPWTTISCEGTSVNIYGCSNFGSNFTINLKVSWLVYLFALLSWIGWWFFSVFAGVGLVSLPMDCINTFRTRPIALPRSKFQQFCSQLTARCDNLLARVEELRTGTASDQVTMSQLSNSKRRRFAGRIVSMEQEYFEIERDWDILKICRDFSNSNPLYYYAALFIGILTLLCSLTWIVHICLFMVPPQGKAPTGFLNTVLIRLQDVAKGDFPVFAIVFYAVAMFYLMWCVVMGNYTLGIRLLIWRVFPMELGKTYINSFLANLWVLLLCDMPIVYFSYLAFPYYARYTAAAALFGTQIRYLKFFKYFFVYKIFLYILLAFVGLTFVYSIICPKNKTKEMVALMDERHARRNRHIPFQRRGVDIQREQKQKDSAK